MSETIENPWREFVENVISGDNYFRAQEYRDLLDYIDGLLTANAAALREKEEARTARLQTMLNVIDQRDAQIKRLEQELADSRQQSMDNGCTALALGKEATAIRAQVERLRSACLFSLYHHQGGSSVVGQVMRRALGIGRFDRMTEEQIFQAKSAALADTEPCNFPDCKCPTDDPVQCLQGRPVDLSARVHQLERMQEQLHNMLGVADHVNAAKKIGELMTDDAHGHERAPDISDEARRLAGMEAPARDA